MTTSQDDERESVSSFDPLPDNNRVRASSSTTRSSVSFDGPQSTVATAEIPTVRASRNSGTSPERFVGQRGNMRPPAWQQEPEVEPAAAVVRLLVWLLLFVFIVALVALLAELAHPAWLSFLRHTTTAPHSLGALHQLTQLITSN